MKMPVNRALVALGAVLALTATACGGGDDVASDEETPDAEESVEEETEEEPAEEEPEETQPEPGSAGELLVWADENRTAALEDVVPAFEDATGIEVTVELVPFDDLREQVNLAAPAGEGPDIFIGAHDWTGELAANGIIAPIDLSSKGDAFVDVGVNAFGFGGENYAVPYVTEAVAMYYNTDLVSEVPATFDELGPACDAAGVENCVVIPGGGAAADAYHNYALVSAFGATVFAYDPATGSYDPSEVLLDSDAALQGAAYLDDQVEAGVVASTDYDTAKNLFTEGQAAFWITGPWELGGLPDTGVNFGVAKIPPISDSAITPFVGAQGFFLSSFSESAVLAQTFLLDFIATDDVMQALYDADPRGTAWVAVQDGLDSADAQTFIASAADGVPMPNIPEMNSVWGPLGDNLLLLRNGEVGPDEAMTTIGEAVRASIAG